MHALQSRSKNLNLAFMRTDARAAERSQNLVAARTAQNFDDGHVGAGWLEQDSRQRTRERVALDALFLFFPPSHHLWSWVFKFLNTLEGVLGISYFD